MVALSVVIPVYNSEGCLDELHRQLVDALRSLSYELILVDDQSTDRSWTVIKGLSARDSAVTGIRLRKNAGQDNAILCGLRQAQGEYVVIMDDDLQHSPYDIPALLDACRTRDLDVCYARFPVRAHAGWKRVGSWFNGKLAELVIDKPRHLYLSPFKVVRGEVIREIVAYTGAFPYVDGMVLAVTQALGEVEVAHYERHQGSSNYTLAKSIWVFLRVATGFSVWPLRFSAGVGMLFALCGFILAAYYLLEYAFYDRHVEGWITIIIFQLVIGGLVMFSLGVIGEYLGRLYLNSNGKPQAAIRELCGGRSGTGKADAA